MQIKTDLVLFKDKVFAANTSFASSAVYVGDYTLGAISLQFEATTTTINGAFTLESSCDPIGETPTNWETIADSTATISGDGDGTVFYNISEIGFNYIRVVFTYDTASDEITMNGKIVAKGQN